ncbi:alcohol dehydrogenase class IV [Pectinatus haikarae]|uniref:Alcohol dehydrogenase class IV n=2 Tax=Pectinatus haikarae TaxID=349096 RepID=A0ABT9YCH7_9FIRM|nr:alcohol dehydrogenase class IV [Pectinatus haikarae]
MFMPFTYKHDVQIEFGPGKTKDIAESVKAENAGKAMLVIDKDLRKLHIADEICAALTENNIAYCIFDDFTPNPSVLSVDSCAKQIRAEHCEIIIAIGGGSSMDVGKGAAVIATNEGGIMDYMYLRKDNAKVPEHPLLPVIAVPTTSGTGSEVSECIVLIDTDNIKDVMYSSILLPKYAYVDPELTYKMPASICANTGLDVLGHALEAYIATLENIMADLFAKEAIKLTFQYLPKAVSGDKEARIYMALASMYAGIAQSKNGCVLPHAVSCPLSASYGVPHGLGVGVAQIPNIEYTRDVCAEQYKQILDYIDPLAHEVPADEAADGLIEKIKTLFTAVGVDMKLDIGAVDKAVITKMSREALLEIDIEGSPRQPVTQEDVEAFYYKMLKL